LNYERLLHEERLVKLKMQKRYVDHICEVIAPDNAFALHFSTVLSEKLGIAVTKDQTERVDTALRDLRWRKRFEDFNLLEAE
jgi:hypothetical protein